MTPIALFYILIGVLIMNYIKDAVLDVCNSKHFNDPIPTDLADVYEKSDYEKSQAYKNISAKFSSFHQLYSLTLTLLFFFFNGFNYVDEIARNSSEHSIVITLVFFGIISIGSDLLHTPLSWYKTFVIEERYGFNNTSSTTFILDKLKSILVLIVAGGGLLSLMVWFYEFAGTDFWIYAWLLVTIFTLSVNMFYSKLIVPLFNKQQPLEEGPLKKAIQKYAQTVGFQLNAIYVLDGSKRSSKANAYFSGFGKQKRITLYDTLIHDLETDEIVAVLAHEIGHYKHKHIIVNLITSILLAGFTLWLLSVFISLPILSEALGVAIPSFHIAFIAFGILYTPLSEITGVAMNIISRKFEYQADNYTKETFDAAPLITALKKLSRNNLSNLTPHAAYVYLNYSHPTLLQRVKNLKK